MAIRSCLLILAFFPLTSGKAFLGANPDIDVAAMREELRGVLGEVLGGGHGIDSARFQNIRKNLAPMFRALPKNRRGRLSAQVMRYAVQRYFSERHGWIMKGFEPHAVMANASEIEEEGHILQSKLPGYIRSTLEQKFSMDGFALDDVAFMVASLERLTSDEVVRGMEIAFRLNSHPASESLNPESLTNVLSSYLVTEMMEGSANNISQHTADMQNINNTYPHWDSTFNFVLDVAGNDAFARKSSTNPFVNHGFVFEDAVRIGQRISEEFGPWSDHECKEMKSKLAEMDIHDTGRVALSDFYGKNQKGAWQFTEASAYLRQLGALDESSSRYGPQVIIPNYISGMNNCITSAPYFSICCLNECDLVYQHLENVIPSSSAPAGRILDAIGSMPHTFSEGRNLSVSLRSKLETIATLHDGNVPLHGRLLAQWLHFAFPRECPYPHAAGTFNPQLAERWQEAVGGGTSSFASEEDIKQHLVSEVAREMPSPEAGSEMWNLNEALFDASTPSDAFETDWPRSVLRIGTLMGMVGALGTFVLKEAGRICTTAQTKGKAVEYNV